ncbi:MAG: SpoIIE family protein phosphatase [Tepidisphaeraceae bacterium]
MSTVTSSHNPASVFDTLDSQVTGLADQVARLTQELDTLRKRDSAVSLAMQRLDEEQRLAARLQHDFLPKKLPQAGSVQFHTLYRPAAYVSGDLYDVMRLDENHVGFYIADAVGHGMPAALLTMFMKNALVTKEIGDGTYRLLEPSQTISKLNRSLCDQNLSHATFATAAYGMINTQTLELTFSSAGHPHPILLRDGKLSDLACDGALLGIFDNETFHNCRVQLQTGDRVFCYTDGIEVAFSDDLPDTERWRTEFALRGNLSTAALIQSVADQLDSTNGSLAPKDDLTIVGIEIR